MNDKPISETLRAVADAAEQTKDTAAGPRFRNKRARRDPSQVYAIRIPVQVLEDVRRLAAERGTQPSALMREWVLERLNEEVRDRPSVAVQRRLAAALPSKVVVHADTEVVRGLSGGGKSGVILAALSRVSRREGVV